MRKINLVTVMIVVLVLFIAFVAVVALFYSGNERSSITQETIGVGMSDKYSILLLGRDNSAGLCDVIIVASIDMRSGGVSVMQIPRDTYFNYGNGEHNKINGAPCILGISQFANELQEALGLRIDCYLCIGLKTLEQIIDMVSGIEIDVPTDMDYDDPSQNLSIHLKAGNNTLNGSQALGFLRYRSGYMTGDIGRLDAQKIFLNAFFKRMSEQKNPVIFYNIFRLVSTKCETNINEQDIISIGLKLKDKKDMKTYYMTAPGEAIQSKKSGAWYYILSRPSMIELLSARFGIGEKDFDNGNKFVDKQVKSFYDIYEKRYDYRIYSADDIDNNKVNIN